MSYVPLRDREGKYATKRTLVLESLHKLLVNPSKTEKFLGLGYSFLVLLLLVAIISPHVTTPHFISPIPPMYRPDGQVRITESDLINTPYGRQVKNNFAIVPVDSLSKTTDRALKLKTYLESKKSPLASYADLIVSEADEHGIDYTLIVAISKIETGFGRNLSGSFNAGNIMAFSGGKRIGAKNFDSWGSWIKEESALLGNYYRENMLKGIQLKYCPSYECNPDWVDLTATTSREIINLTVAK